MNDETIYKGPEYPTQAHGSIPAFHSYEEEAAFWDTHSTTDFTHETEPIKVRANTSHTLDYNIRERLADYITGKISLREFEDGFFSETWDIDDADNQTLANLVYGIKLRLAEYSHGDWTETDLRNMLSSS